MTQSFLTKTFSRHYMLFALAAFCVTLLLVRAKITQSIFFFFLIWNLFLAYTPLGLTSIMRQQNSQMKKWYWFYPALLLWLLILPNAPYIITDFVHLKKETNVPVWFEVLLIASFSTCGMLFGLASMKDVFSLITKRSSQRVAWIAMAAFSVLCGFGMYVGRFLRYNSWDILQKPYSLTVDIFCSLTNAETCKPAWGITLGFGMLMFLLFNLYHTPKSKKNLQ